MKREEFSKVSIATKHPARVALAIVEDKKSKYNMITLEWFMKTSIKPPMFAISIGHTRYSHECLQNVRFFNLCLPSKEMTEVSMICGTKSGRDIDKFEENGLVFSGTSEDKRRMEILELPGHVFFHASQFHPEFTSIPWSPNPLFKGFIDAAIERMKLKKN